jgi:hypothetical protein
MNTTNQTAIKESKMKITTPKLIRWAGLSAMATGIIFIVVQMIHPPDMLASVTTSSWAIVHYLSIVMCLFGQLGITGIYAKQVKEAGWLGLVGYLLFSLFLAFTMAFVFIEALIEPSLATVSPKFVEGLLGMVDSVASEINLGVLPTLYLLTGLLYIVGGVLFGTATFRARILPRWAAGMLAVGVMLPVVLPHDIVRLAAVPVGLALAWLGYALWSGREEKVSKPINNMGSPQLGQLGVK